MFERCYKLVTSEISISKIFWFRLVLIHQLATMAGISSISRHEFSRMLQKCTPPPGWSKSIGAFP